MSLVHLRSAANTLKHLETEPTTDYEYSTNVKYYVRDFYNDCGDGGELHFILNFITEDNYYYSFTHSLLS